MRRWWLRFADLVAVIAVIAAVVVIVQRLDEASGRPAGGTGASQGPGDRDGDGVPDGEDLAPDVAGEASTEPESTPEPAQLPPADDCKRKGITRKTGGEGACYEPSGRRVRVVNRDTRLDLDEIAAQLRGIEVTRRTARRTATITVTLRVRNKLDGIVDFRPEQAGLLLRRTLFKVDVAREGARRDSLLRRGLGLRARDEVEGTLRFDVPLRALRWLERNGNLQIAQFSDISLSSAGATVGIFRTYR